ncbi:MAG: SIMPL domain-containing protein [Gammaproteobacteria bacterium]|nr:SIMPL domain-containing protein [Gammaproteobacteria bacterium]
MTNSRFFRYLVLLATTIFVLTTATACRAQDDGTRPRILVTGQGSVDVEPDMAVLALTVTREAETAREALDANSAAIKDVLDAMKAEGIKARDLQTSNFSIQPKYFYPQQKSSNTHEPPRIIAYTVRNSLSVRIRDIGSLGHILDKSVTLGVNEGGNISFTNDDPSAAITRARVLAMKDALARAKTLAEAGGVKVGRLLEISEQSFNPRPMPMARAERSFALTADAVPVATGENTYRVSVNVTFGIDQ